MIASINGKRGFTLVEIVVSMLLLSIVLAGMLVVFVVGRRSVGKAGHKVQAISFAQETIEGLKGKVGGYLWSPADHDLDEGVDRSTAALSGDLANLGGVRTYTVENIPAGSADGLEYYKRVTVTVRWTEP